MSRSFRLLVGCVVAGAVGVAGGTARAAVDQVTKPPAILLRLPVEFHHLPHELVNGGIECAVWHDDEMLTTATIGFTDVAGGGDFSHTYNVPFVFDHAGVSLDDAHWMCVLKFAARLDGVYKDIGHFVSGPNLVTNPYGRPQYEMAPAAGTTSCIAVGGPMLPQPLRTMKCYDSATDGTCPCGCGGTGRCTTGAPGFIGLMTSPTPHGQPVTNPASPVVPLPAKPTISNVYTLPKLAPVVTGLSFTSTGTLRLIRP